MKSPLKSLPLLTVALVMAACGQTPSATAPTALGAQSVGAQQASFRALAVQRGITYQEVASYSTLFNGFSVEASEAEINQITRLPGVLAVYPVERVERPRVQRDLNAALGELQRDARAHDAATDDDGLGGGAGHRASSGGGAGATGCVAHQSRPKSTSASTISSSVRNGNRFTSTPLSLRLSPSRSGCYQPA